MVVSWQGRSNMKAGSRRMVCKPSGGICCPTGRRWLALLAVVGLLACAAGEGRGARSSEPTQSGALPKATAREDVVGAPRRARPEPARREAPTVTPEPWRPARAGGAVDPSDDQAPRLAKLSAPAEPFGQPTVVREQSVVRVLLYHSIGSSASRPSVELSAFREQLAWMRDNDVEVIRLSQLLDFMDGKLMLPRHAAVITIDDGELNGYSVAYPILKEQGLPFALGIATRTIHQHRSRGALSWDQIREMLDSGLCEVASHSVTHRAMTSLPDEVALRELERSRIELEQTLGLRPEAFFYPLGDHDRRIRRLTRESGYRAAFVAHGGPTTVGTPRYWIRRYDVKPDTSLRIFRSFFNHGIRMHGQGSARSPSR